MIWTAMLGSGVVGSTSGSGPEGRGFEPYLPNQHLERSPQIYAADFFFLFELAIAAGCDFECPAHESRLTFDRERSHHIVECAKGMDNILRLLIKPSTYIRAMWLAVAALHAWLFARRLIEGEWFGGMNQARLVLAMAACIYGAVRMWRPATFLDDSPRKAWAFALLLIIGHFGVSSENYRRVAENAVNGVEWNHVVLVTTVMVVIAAAGVTLLAMLRTLQSVREQQLLIPLRVGVPRRYSTSNYALHQRPPPQF